MIAMSDKMLTGAEKASDSSATVQMTGNVVTKAVLVLVSNANTEVRISKPLCHFVQSAKAAHTAPAATNTRCCQPNTGMMDAVTPRMFSSTANNYLRKR